MSATLPSPALERPPTRTKVVPPLPSAYDLIAWDSTYLDQVAGLFHDANRDTLDARIYPQLKTYEETRRMAGAIRDGGAGRFVEEASCIVLYGGEPGGAIMLVQMPKRRMTAYVWEATT